MVISQLRDVRSTAKAFVTAQNTASHDMLKWSSSEENPAIQDTFAQLSELNALWTDVQKDFTDNLKAFIAQFSMILEGEHRLDQAKAHVTACEMKATKIKKELRKAARRSSVAPEVQQLEIQLVQAENSFVMAQNEVVGQVQENEAVKLIRIKEGLLKLSESYLELATKCRIIHEAHRDIAHLIPDVHSSELHEIRYTGPEPAKEAVLRAKDGVRAYTPHPPRIVPCAPIPDGPPPPYTPTNHIENSPYNPYYTSHSSPPEVRCMGSASENSNLFHFSPQSFGSYQSPEARDDGSTRDSFDSNSSNRNPFHQDDSSRLSNSRYHTLNSTANHDVRHTDYEGDLVGAFGRVTT